MNFNLNCCTVRGGGEIFLSPETSILTQSQGWHDYVMESHVKIFI